MSHWNRSVLLLLVCASMAIAAEPATQPSDVSINVHSVRFNRSSPELQRRFANRYYSDGGPGVALTLMLTVKEGTMLPLGREAITIDTFVDDTYQNLLAPGREGGYQQNTPAISEDGKSVLVPVMTAKSPALDAGRVFVRGSLQARLARGEEKTATAKLPLNVGAAFDVGPFKTTVKSVTDNANQGRSNLSVSLAVEGDAARINKVRVINADGRPVSNDREARFNEQGGGTERASTLYLNLGPVAKEDLTLEYTFVESADNVRIPFEAQVDVGVAKAGPMEAVGPGKPAGRSNSRERAWPPPPDAGTAIPPRRGAFVPATQPEIQVKLEKAAVDLFSLTVARPSPAESKEVRWSNPPWSGFRATGFTIARLMVSAPDVTILSFPPGGVTISRFEDDKTGKLDPTIYRDNSGAYPGRQGIYASIDGQQALLTVSMASSPTPGATRCTLAGSVQAKVACGDRSDVTEPVALNKGESVKVGPFEARFTSVRQTPPMTPGGGTALLEVTIVLTGPTARVRSIELVDPATNQVVNDRQPLMDDESRPQQDNLTFNVALRQSNMEKVILRVRHFDKSETVEIPFEFSTGIGL